MTISEILPNDEDEHIFRNDLEGQALTIRGLALLTLRFFGYTYLKITASLELPIITSASATADSKPSRNTVAECYDQIIKDLKNAASLMIPTYSWSGTSLNQKIYP